MFHFQRVAEERMFELLQLTERAKQYDLNDLAQEIVEVSNRWNDYADKDAVEMTELSKSTVTKVIL